MKQAALEKRSWPANLGARHMDEDRQAADHMRLEVLDTSECLHVGSKGTSQPGACAAAAAAAAAAA